MILPQNIARPKYGSVRQYSANFFYAITIAIAPSVKNVIIVKVILCVLSWLLNPINSKEEIIMHITRTRCWRIAQKQRNQSRDKHTALPRFREEKNWKMLYMRSVKVKRAAQLRMAYPRVTRQQLTNQSMEEYCLANECALHLQS